MQYNRSACYGNEPLGDPLDKELGVQSADNLQVLIASDPP